MKFGLPPVSRQEIDLAQSALMSKDEKQIDAYRAHYAALPPQTKAYVGYSLAAMFHLTESFGLPPYMFFFKKEAIKLHTPFAFIGWAGEHSSVGPAFSIRPECFAGGPVTLYYSDDDMQVYSSSVRERMAAHAQDLAQDIAKYSSGLSDVHAVLLCGSHDSVVTKPDSEKGETYAVAFTLDPSAVKESVVVQGKNVSAEETGGYVFILPRAGEFNCTMGELFDDGLRLPLREDSYCMK